MLPFWGILFKLSMKTRLLLLSLFTLLAACQAPAEEVPLTDEAPVEDTEVTEEATLTYSDEELGFSLELPASWEGYIAEKRELQWGAYGVADSVDFLIDDLSIFNLSWYTPEQWANIAASEGPIPTKLAENDEWVFAYSTAQDTSSTPATMQAGTEVDAIVASFKLL